MSALKSRVRLTAGRVESFTCPPGKSQAFLWDTDTPTLALRATPTGRKTYVFESRLNGSTLRINIGTLAATLEQVRTKARGPLNETNDRLYVSLDELLNTAQANAGSAPATAPAKGGTALW